ncbi:hypothetical protein ABZ078_07435 [Streptomyces sp. NPDC006385]|uniref:hypothetical protein n=1 Tax=Streptomyces sp. NPDC006385 TaxID=3156761 RepID=UPI0033A7FD29
MTLVAEKKRKKEHGAGAAVPARASRHPLRAEFVRGIAPWTGSVVLVTLAVGLATTSAQWQGGWAETRERLHTVAQLLGVPLALAAGCWQGGRERRRRTEDLLATAVRGRLARFLAAALPVAVGAAAGYAVAAALALLATRLYATGDEPDLVAPVTDAVTLAAAALIGHVLGRLLPWRLTAPLLAVAGYVVLGVVAYDSRGPLRHLSPIGYTSNTELPVWWQPLAMVVWTGGVGAAAVLGYAARHRFTALLPLAAATAAGALLVQTGDGLWHTNPVTRRQVCDTSTSPQICVNARYEKLLPQVTDALSGLTGRLDGVQNLPVRFTDLPGEPGPDEVDLPMITPFGWSVARGRLTDPRQFAWEAGMALYSRVECDLTGDPRLARTDDAVQHYLAPSPAERRFDELAAEGSEAERAELRARLDARARLKAMGDEERRAWLSEYFATARACDPSEVPAL